jgi:hypothetical protein
MRRSPWRIWAPLAIGILTLTGAALVAVADDAERLAKLTPKQRQILLTYEKAVAKHEKALDAYWARVAKKRAERRDKRKSGLTFSKDDYVDTHPPKYDGPPEPTEILKLLPEDQRKTGKKKVPPLPVVADYLRHAKEHFDFVPHRIPEADFKRNYAHAALAAGLSKDQILRVYALETGGMGTADMQSGINPVTKKGRAVSSALGYAQLLDANSVDQISRHGREYAHRLEAMADAHGVSEQRREELLRKAAALRAMVKVARSVPASWDEHRKLSNTARGMGLHAMNLDGDVGPWLQVDKLADIVRYARERGVPELSGAELELLNLSGPGTGLEMLQPVSRDMPTANFYERGGYYRNPVVHDKTAAELLEALEQRMQVHLKKEGAREFAAIFDEIIVRRQASGDD